MDYAARAVELLRHELGLDEGDLVAGVGDLVAGRPDSRTVKASLSILSVALYNQACLLFALAFPPRLHGSSRFLLAGHTRLSGGQQGVEVQEV